MYKLKITSLILGLVAVASLASCNDGDDYKTLTKEEKALCYQTVSGNYNGKLVYVKGVNKNGQAVNDTIDTQWSVSTDSTLTIKNLPSRIYGVWVTDSVMKKAIDAAPAQNLTCYTGYFQTSPVAFWLNPAATPAQTLSYGGAEHKVQVAFYTNYTQSYGVYKSDKKQIQMQVVMGAIYVDGKVSDKLKRASAFFLYGTKM